MRNDNNAVNDIRQLFTIVAELELRYIFDGRARTQFIEGAAAGEISLACSLEHVPPPSQYLQSKFEDRARKRIVSQRQWAKSAQFGAAYGRVEAHRDIVIGDDGWPDLMGKTRP